MPGRHRSRQGAGACRFACPDPIFPTCGHDGAILMDSTIVLILLQDGVLNGAIYALLGLALVLVFVVTRVIFIPQGEFVAFGALTLAFMVNGKIPGTVNLLLIMGALVFLVELRSEEHTSELQSLMRISYAVFCLQKK